MYVYVCGMVSTVKDGRTPVCIAAEKGYAKVVEFLVLKANVDPNQADEVSSRA